MSADERDPQDHEHNDRCDYKYLLDEYESLDAAIVLQGCVIVPGWRWWCRAAHATATLPDFSVLSHFISAPRASLR